MIQIKNKHDCCGCSACVQVCPIHCISFNEDEQGFRYPFVNEKLCTNCGLCEKACPLLGCLYATKPLNIYAAQNPNDETRLNSSSGGVFSVLAELVISKGGIVFGARFDEKWDVIHDYTKTKDGIELFRGSKYAQSFIGETYIQAKNFLKKGKIVLFSGTGCQIAGLKFFLKRDYENLLTVEIVCHSVPSPLLWRKYRDEIAGGNKLTYVNFRSKINGWKAYSIILKTKEFEHSEQNGCPYIKGILSNLTTRPSCTQCPTRHGKSGADLIIGDCWGIQEILPSFDDNKGTSIVEVLTPKGGLYFRKSNIRIQQISTEIIYLYNKGLQEPAAENPFHDKFFHQIKKTSSVRNLLIKYTIQKEPVSSGKHILNKIKELFIQITT